MTVLFDVNNWEDDKEARNEYWRRLRQCYTDFDGELDDFIVFLNRQYGIRMSLTMTGEIAGDYAIVDEQAYLLFLMKYV